MHASGSRIMDKCITHIRLLESPCSFVRPSGTKFQPHHTHMRYSQGLRMTDASYINASCTCIMIKEHICICIVQTCIMYICIRVKVSPCMKNLPHHTYIQSNVHKYVIIKDNRCMHHTYMHQGQGQRSTIYASYMHASGSRIMDKCIIHICAMCIIVTCLRIKNIYIIHTCIRVKDRGT